MNATLHLTTPTGAGVEITFDAGTPAEAIAGVLERAEKIAAHYVGKGWSVQPAEPTGPSAAELATGPSFAGYPCSPTVDDKGMPTWIIVDGKQAQRREKQGDIWYSVKGEAGAYVQVLRIPKGEKAPEVKGI